eukprot:6484093-Amphidinium_carterae.2
MTLTAADFKQSVHHDPACSRLVLIERILKGDIFVFRRGLEFTEKTGRSRWTAHHKWPAGKMSISVYLESFRNGNGLPSVTLFMGR